MVFEIGFKFFEIGNKFFFACSSVCQFIAVDFPNHFLSFHLLRTILNLLSSFTETDFLITLNFKFKQVLKVQQVFWLPFM